MLNYITYIIKQSIFNTWIAFGVFHGYKETDKGSLKKRMERAINFLNKTLFPLGLEVWVREIKKNE